MQYWRIGGRDVDLGEKPPYEPAVAKNRTADHAATSAIWSKSSSRDYFEQTGKFGVISAAYDTELFGHWWFEGVDWLKEVLRNLAASDSVKLTTASRIVEEETPERVMILPESSWGAGGSHFTWLNDDTEWMWPLIHAAERRMEALVAENPDAEGTRAELLNQIARELLLARAATGRSW